MQDGTDPDRATHLDVLFAITEGIERGLPAPTNIYLAVEGDYFTIRTPDNDEAGCIDWAKHLDIEPPRIKDKPLTSGKDMWWSCTVDAQWRGVSIQLWCALDPEFVSAPKDCDCEDCADLLDEAVQPTGPAPSVPVAAPLPRRLPGAEDPIATINQILDGRVPQYGVGAESEADR